MRRWSGRFARGLLLTAMAAIVPACGTSGGGTLTPTVAPASPGGLATQSGSGRIVLAWNSSPAAEHYTVKRSSTSGGPYLPLPGASALSGTSYSDTTVVNGTTYYYVVAAGNPFGQSADGPETSATPGFFGTLISAGRYSSYALLEDGTLWSWGSNQSFELGNGGTQALSNVAVRVVNLTNIKAVASSWDHCLALLADGTVWGWGSNAFGILGDGSPDFRKNVPVQALGITGAVEVAAGLSHSMALRSDGSVWTWGKGMGPGLSDTTLPAPIPSLSGVVKIASGSSSCYALRDDGTVWAWGMNDYGQLGIGTIGGAVETPTRVLNLDGVTGISAGSFHAGALRSDGGVWMWGNNGSGQLGDGSNNNSLVPVPVPGLSNVTSIAINFAFTLALLGNGTVMGWGNNAHGELGSAGGSTPLQLSDLVDIRAVAAGSSHTLALGYDGRIWCRGYNNVCQLGSGTGATQIFPVEVANLTDVTAIEGGTDHGLALRSDGTLWGWGSNSIGQLFVPAPSSSYPYRVQIPYAAPPFTAISAGGDGFGSGFSVARKSNGTLFAWGGNGSGQLGNGAPTPPGQPMTQVINLPGSSPSTTITAHSCGAAHTLALASSGIVWTWGSNSQGQLGNNSMAANSAAPVQVSGLANVSAVAGGFTHSLAVVGSGPTSTVWAWGSNASGQLGYVGALSRVPVQVLGLTGVAAVAAGEAFSLALKTDGTVWAWGINNWGQLGDGLPISSSSTSATPVQVVGLSGITALAAGEYHAVALRSDGSAWTWGGNFSGPLGNGSVDSSSLPAQAIGLTGITQIAAGVFTTLAVGSDGRAWACGWNASGQVGIGSSVQSAAPILLTR